MYAVVSPLRFPGPECAISSFSVYILCVITCFHLRRHNGQVGTFGSRDCVVQSSNPGGFAYWIWIFIIASGMSERSSCIFRRIHVLLLWASQVAYECFSFTAVPQTDLKYFNLETKSSLGSAWLTGKSTPTGLDASPEPGSHGYLRKSV